MVHHIATHSVVNMTGISVVWFRRYVVEEGVWLEDQQFSTSATYLSFRPKNLGRYGSVGMVDF